MEPIRYNLEGFIRATQGQPPEEQVPKEAQPIEKLSKQRRGWLTKTRGWIAISGAISTIHGLLSSKYLLKTFNETIDNRY